MKLEENRWTRKFAFIENKAQKAERLAKNERLTAGIKVIEAEQDKHFEAGNYLKAEGCQNCIDILAAKIDLT